ncbi:CinA family protein [Rhodococcus sp. NPDC003322]
MPEDVAEGSDRSRALADRLAEIVIGRQLTVGCAESLTSGAVASRLGATRRAAEWFRGGVVAYSREVKHSLLKVPEGPVVCATAARVMAESCAAVLGADLAVAVTGVGGPGTQDGRPAGTVWFGVAGLGHTHVEEQRFGGDPVAVLEQTVVRALELLIVQARTP